MRRTQDSYAQIALGGFFMLLAVPVRRAIVAAGNTPPHVL